MREIFIRLFLIILMSGLSTRTGYPADTSNVLVASDQWESSSNVLVQKEIDVNTENRASPADRNEIVVKFKPGTPTTTINRIISEAGTQVIKKNESIGFYKLQIISGQLSTEVVQILKQNPNVVYAEPVYYYQSRFVPNDEKYPHQWNLDNPLTEGIRMQKAWDITRGSPDTVIAIIDTGVAYESYYDQNDYYYWAPDLAKTHFVPGYDFVNNDTHPNDDHWHGTLLAGIIAQTTNNGLGTAGICPECSIMPVKVLDKNGYGNTVTIAEGIIWAADHNADVINMSFGGTEPSAVIKDACSYAFNKGSTLVCAAGNRGLSRLIFPAAYDDYCIAVGATRFDETRAYYSDYGPSLDLVAPGGDTRIDQNRDRLGDGIVAMTFGPQGYNDWVYLFAIGTSMATAHVSGVAGLVISAGIAATPQEVRQVLEETAEDRGPIGFDIEQGWGNVDAYAAVTYAATDSDVTIAGAEAETATQDAGSEEGQTPLESGAATEEDSARGVVQTAALSETTGAELNNVWVDSGGSLVAGWDYDDEDLIRGEVDHCGCQDADPIIDDVNLYQKSDVVLMGRADTVENSFEEYPGDETRRIYRTVVNMRIFQRFRGVRQGWRREFYTQSICSETGDDPLLPPCDYVASMCHFRMRKKGFYLIYGTYEDGEIRARKCTNVSKPKARQGVRILTDYYQ